MGKWAYFPISALSNLTELRLTGNQLPEPPTGVARSLPLPLSISLYVCLLRLKWESEWSVLRLRVHAAPERYVVHIDFYVVHIDFYVVHIDFYVVHIDFYVVHIDFYVLGGVTES